MDIRISVIITCYNEAEIVGDAIKSVLNQTNSKVIEDILIVDDGSTDSSKDVIETFLNKNDKIKYLYQTNKGLASARNLGIIHSSGNYLAFLDGDDIWHPEKINLYYNEIRSNPQVGLFYGSYFRKRRDGWSKKKVIPRKYSSLTTNFFIKFYQYGGPILPSTVILKKSVVDDVGMFDPHFRKAQDMELWLRVASKYSFHFVDHPLVDKMETFGSLGSNKLEKSKFMLQALDRIEELHPRLRKYRNKREAIIFYTIGLYLLKKNDRRGAMNSSLESIRANCLFHKAYWLLLRSFMPV